MNWSCAASQGTWESLSELTYSMNDSNHRTRLASCRWLLHDLHRISWTVLLSNCPVEPNDAWELDTRARAYRQWWSSTQLWGACAQCPIRFVLALLWLCQQQSACCPWHLSMGSSSQQGILGRLASKYGTADFSVNSVTFHRGVDRHRDSAPSQR